MKPIVELAALPRHIAALRAGLMRRLASPQRPLDGAPDWRGPIRKGFVVVGVTLGVGGLWSATARLDSAVVARGSVVVETDRKAVQHLEGGLIEAVNVRDGAEVEAGQTLLRLDTTSAAAQRGVARLTVLQALGEEARLAAEIDQADRIAFPDEISHAPEARDAMRIMLDQERQFRERENARRLEVSILAERQSQSRKQYQSTQAQRDAAVSQVASIADEIAKLRPLADQGFVASSRINPLQRSLTDLQGRVGSLDADMARLSVANEEIRLQADQVARRMIEEASSKLADCRVRLADAREKLRVAEDVMARAEVKAPRKGRVVGLKVHTVGAVVKPGETMMEIVPQDDDLVVSAKISPMDVNHLRPGMAAEVRLPSFKGRATPITIGEVTSVAADALRDEVSQQTLYEVRVGVRSSGFPPKIRGKLRPGMPAEVLISTGERTLIAYLMQPLSDAMRSGLREE